MMEAASAEFGLYWPQGCDPVVVNIVQQCLIEAEIVIDGALGYVPASTIFCLDSDIELACLSPDVGHA